MSSKNCNFKPSFLRFCPARSGFQTIVYRKTAIFYYFLANNCFYLSNEKTSFNEFLTIISVTLIRVISFFEFHILRNLYSSDENETGGVDWKLIKVCCRLSNQKPSIIFFRLIFHTETQDLKEVHWIDFFPFHYNIQKYDASSDILSHWNILFRCDYFANQNSNSPLLHILLFLPLYFLL